MSNSSLVNKTILANSGNYTKGRVKSIKKITIHHMAGNLTIEQCGAIFQRAGRGGSSHYGIGSDGRIGQYVKEENTAWTDSNWDSNSSSVTIETANNKVGGNWSVSDNALNSLIKLVADIGKRNNLGTLVKGVNVTWHRMYCNTTCPGEYLISKMDYIVKEANKINQNKPVEDFFTAGSTYKLLYSKCIRRTPAIANNILKVNQVDLNTRKLLTSQSGNAMFKVGTQITSIEICKDKEGRVWGSYGNCWYCMQNKDGSKNVVKVK